MLHILHSKATLVAACRCWHWPFSTSVTYVHHGGDPTRGETTGSFSSSCPPSVTMQN